MGHVGNRPIARDTRLKDKTNSPMIPEIFKLNGNLIQTDSENNKRAIIKSSLQQILGEIAKTSTQKAVAGAEMTSATGNKIYFSIRQSHTPLCGRRSRSEY